jgi:hypothetical protein
VVHGTVEFANNVSTTFVTRENNKWTKISGTHLSIKRLFNLGVAHKDQVPTFEVEISDCSEVDTLESEGCTETGFENGGMEMG